jgi:hypothetical protein
LFQYLLLKEVVKGFLSSIFAVLNIQRFGSDHSGLKIIAEVGFFFVFDRVFDSFPTLVRCEGVIKTAPPATFQIGKARRAMIEPGGFAPDPGIHTAIPAT